MKSGQKHWRIVKIDPINERKWERANSKTKFCFWRFWRETGSNKVFLLVTGDKILSLATFEVLIPKDDILTSFKKFHFRASKEKVFKTFQTYKKIFYLIKNSMANQTTMMISTLKRTVSASFSYSWPSIVENTLRPNPRKTTQNLQKYLVISLSKFVKMTSIIQKRNNDVTKWINKN